MKTSAPEKNHDLRAAVYAGDIFRIPAHKESLALVNKINSLLKAGLKDMRRIHDIHTYHDVSQKIAPIRAFLSESAEGHDMARSMMRAHGFDPQENVFDPARLRCVFHNGHLSDGSARAYALHRDTWYGNPQSQVNWWIPLHDVNGEESFAFYPEYFSAPVANGSAKFDYKDWMRVVGWQGIKGGVYDHYPAAEQPIEPEKGFTARAGDIVLFSGAHLHGTCKNITGFTRWSLDFRTVHLGDLAAQRGAPNVDNGSLPLAVEGYIRS